MKTLIAIASIVLSFFTAEAQTTNTNNALLPPVVPRFSIPGLALGGSMPTNIVGAANNVITMAKPFLPFLTNLHGVSLDLDGTYSSGNRLGGIAALNFTIPALPDWFSVGIAGEYVGTNWFTAPVNVKVGQTVNIPVINYPAYLFTSTGLSTRVDDGAVGDQSIIGAAINFNLGKGWYLDGDGGKLFLTQPGAPSAYFGGIRLGRAF